MSHIISAIALPSLDCYGPRRPNRPLATPQTSSKPLRLLPLTPFRTKETVYGFGRIDCSGRIGAAEVIPALGWSVGTLLNGRVCAGSLILSTEAHGRIRVLDMMRLRLPANLRRRCGVTAGMGLLLAADPLAKELVVFPPTVLDKLSQLRDRAEEPA